MNTISETFARVVDQADDNPTALWFDLEKDEIVDWEIANPGEEIRDDGHAGFLTTRVGREVVYLGTLPSAGIKNLIGEVEVVE